MVDVMECAVCFNIYSNINKPLVLPCGHTNCEPCLRRLSSRNLITCPMCNKEFIANFTKFQVNYSLMPNSNPSPSQKPRVSNLGEITSKLQKEIQALESLDNQLAAKYEEYEGYSKESELELFNNINSLIQAIQNAKTQLKSQINDVQNTNKSRIAQHRTDISRKIEQRKSILRNALDAQRNSRDLDSTMEMEFSVLQDVKPLELKMKKAELGPPLSVLTTDLTKTLMNNLIITDTQAQLIFEAVVKGSQDARMSTRSEYGTESNQSGSRRGFRGVRRNERSRGFRGRGRMADEGRMENDRVSDDDFGQEAENYSHRGRGNLHGKYEANAEWDPVNEPTFDNRRPGGERRGRRGRFERFGRNNRINGMNERGSIQNEEIKQGENDWDRESSASREAGRENIRGRGVRGYRGRNPRHPADNQGICKWFIRIDRELKELPQFVYEQIDRKLGQFDIIKIIRNGKIVNIADVRNMQYYHLDENENRKSCHELVHIND